MSTMSQGQTVFAPSYRRPASETSVDFTEVAVLAIWGLVGLSVSALCHLSATYANLGDLMALLG